MAEPVSRALVAEKAELLRSLHHGPRMLVLPHAVAASIGYEDHERAPAEEMFAAAARIIAAVSIPVSVDLEAGYQLPPDEFAGRAIAIGAAGFNFEDTDHHGNDVLVPASTQAE